ncbi:uncharacterized protein LOC129740465 [Uranotaenia lowii]|uniref:uncharacterized protein LOC129740465 n=1 Tax=Uranotaenia lowii TaxID=190385 RepID=UPI0024783BAD|nr:uncharacterized protein LOC129740465 [Uranotaenia lowii]XP_055588127.1 uncharacterized protein LOC129740465 [Uranotaenia lowii]
MTSVTTSTHFFQNGTAAQFEYVLNLYPQVLKLKAENRGVGKKPEKLIRLDDWYQNTLPKLIAKRGKDAHLVHEELAQTMEWKQTRGKSYPQLTHLIKINTPRAVMVETKKALKKLPNLEQAVSALVNLKGVGITMASAVLAAAVPETAPFMADECLNAIPEFETVDYTAKEYLKFITYIHQTMDRLNKEIHATDEPSADPAASAEGNGTEEVAVEATNGEKKVKKWTAHKVELALWAHAVASDLNPDLLKDMPESNGVAMITNGNTIAHDEDSQNGQEASEESNQDGDCLSKDTLITNGTENADSLDVSENGISNQEDASVDAASNEAPVVLAKTMPADSLDDCAKSGDSLDGPPATAVDATTAAVATLCTADGDVVADSDSQSSNSQKRPLYCDETSEDQPELSAPKLIKL